jgi:hypothetical protein
LEGIHPSGWADFISARPQYCRTSSKLQEKQEGAMIADLYLKRGDRYPPLKQALRYDDDTSIDLSGTTVRFILRRVGATAVLGGAAIVTDAPNGVVRYNWQVNDTALAGNYIAEWEIAYPDGKLLTVPNRKKITVLISDDLG